MNKNRQNQYLLILMSFFLLALMGCSINKLNEDSIARGEQLYKESQNWKVTFQDDFDFLDDSKWTLHSGSMFAPDCSWGNESIAYVENGCMHLPLIKREFELEQKGRVKRTHYQGSAISTKSPIGENGKPLREDQKFHYGRYEARFKCALGRGQVFAFFNYGAIPNERGKRIVHEIDWEILGRGVDWVTCTSWLDPIKAVTTNLINFPMRKFKGMEQFDIREFHNYCFIWQEGEIFWYVDGKLIRYETFDVPYEPLPIMFNHWIAGKGYAWAGEPDDKAVPTDPKACPMAIEWVKFAPIDTN